MGLQSHIQDASSLLVSKLTSPGPQNIYRGFRSLGSDIITEFSFGKSYKSLEVPGFAHSIILSVDRIAEWQFWTMYFAPIAWLMHDVGPVIVKVLGAGFVGGMSKMLQDAEDAVDECLRGEELHKASIVPMMKEMGVDRLNLIGEATNLVIAGGHTVSNTLTIGMVRMVQTKGVQDRVYEELCGIWPDIDEECPDWQELEELPYLVVLLLGSRINC